MHSNKTNYLIILLLLMLILTPIGLTPAKAIDHKLPSTTFTFSGDRQNGLSGENIMRVKDVTKSTLTKMNSIMPGLADTIHFTFLVTDRDLSKVNGVTGRADKPNEIEIILSSSFEGGLGMAIESGLEITLFHELHHTIRGWTIYENKFGSGIDIAAINEGLADVFSEIYAGHPHSNYSNDINVDSWVTEVLLLPKDANYGDWMFSHPDGRESIGYKVGSYVVKKAMTRSSIDILELGLLPIQSIYELAGYHK